MPAINPGDLFPSYEYVASGGTVAANSIVIPLSALPGLTTAEANATTGDGRKVMYEISKAAHVNLQGLDAADRPAQFSTGESTPSGQAANEVRKSYTFTFDLNITDTDIAAEPA